VGLGALGKREGEDGRTIMEVSSAEREPLRRRATLIGLKSAVIAAIATAVVLVVASILDG
jgi:hypothetical protein